MNHDRFEEWLYLSVYGELRGDQRDRLDEHLRECDDCRREQEKLIRMLDVISRSAAPDPTEEALESARKSLSAALVNEQRRPLQLLRSLPGICLPGAGAELHRQEAGRQPGHAATLPPDRPGRAPAARPHR